MVTEKCEERCDKCRIVPTGTWRAAVKRGRDVISLKGDTVWHVGCVQQSRSDVVERVRR